MEQTGGDAPKWPFCGHCGRAIPKDSRFCPYCGASTSLPRSVPAYSPYLYSSLPKETTWQKTRRFAAIVVAFVTLAVLIEVALNVVLLLWGVTIIAPNSGLHFPIFIVTPFIVTLFEVTGPAFLLYLGFIVVCIVASFAFMTWKSWRTFNEELMGIRPKGGHSPLFVIATIFFAVVFFNVIFVLLVQAFGVEPSSPGLEDQDLWEIMYDLANASIWEEVITRVLYIGVPLLLYDLVTGHRKPARRYLLGGGFELKGAAIFFLFFSAGMFGVAHVFNWDLWKIAPTFVSGLGLGYLFLRYGLYASVMMHFFVDYLAMPTYVFESDLADVAVGLLTLAILAAGFICFVYYLGKVYTFLTGKEIILEKPVTTGGTVVVDQYNVSVPPPVQSSLPTPQTGFGFVCRYCGNTEARYHDGTLTCTRCQRKN
ncbi:MAG: CPBP family intramembrane metalloprotease [Methanomassiliicoccales archaeon]|nr:MAG: CPBP family intramembrane metalloprotease [Methanomassiliicoccales archaeon]